MLIHLPAYLYEERGLHLVGCGSNAFYLDDCRCRRGSIKWTIKRSFRTPVGFVICGSIVFASYAGISQRRGLAGDPGIVYVGIYLPFHYACDAGNGARTLPA